MSEQDKREEDRHVDAYHRMLERVRHTLEEAGGRTRPGLEHALERARERAVHLGELSRDEAHQVADYVRRDIHDVVDYLGETGNEYGAWFHIDMELIEARLLDLITSVADKTRLELAQLQRQADTYHTGEVAGPGALACTACGEVIHLHGARRIPPCPSCGATAFERIRS